MLLNPVRYEYHIPLQSCSTASQLRTWLSAPEFSVITLKNIKIMLNDKTLHPKTKDITTKSLNHHKLQNFEEKSKLSLFTLVPIKQTIYLLNNKNKIQNFISKTKDKTTKSLKHNKRKPNILRNNPKLSNPINSKQNLSKQQK